MLSQLSSLHDTEEYGKKCEEEKREETDRMKLRSPLKLRMPSKSRSVMISTEAVVRCSKIP